MREGTAHFKRKNKHYLVTSGTTGYLPNPSEIAVGNTWHGPFQVLGNPHPGDESNTSYHSQIASVFKVQGKKDLYIAVADRWLPQQMHFKYDKYAKIFEEEFNPDCEKNGFENADKEFKERIENTMIADYVWLPFRFEGEMGYLDWRDEWSLDEFE